MRAARALVICPNCGDVTVDWTPLNCVWLKALNDSNLNWKRNGSVIAKFLNMDRSKLLMPGARKMLRPELPKTPGAGCAKALLLNHEATVPVAPLFGSPTRFARLVPKVSRRPPVSAAVIVIGNPFWTVAI